MADYTATVPSRRTPEQTWDYLADFTSVVEWDPSMTAARLVAGTPGEVGARFRLTMSQLGKEVELEYVTLEARRPARLVYRAETDSMVSTDTITVSPVGEVTYDAHLELKGLRKVADPLLDVALTRASDKARDGLEEALSHP